MKFKKLTIADVLPGQKVWVAINNKKAKQEAREGKLVEAEVIGVTIPLGSSNYVFERNPAHNETHTKMLKKYYAGECSREDIKDCEFEYRPREETSRNSVTVKFPNGKVAAKKHFFQKIA